MNIQELPLKGFPVPNEISPQSKTQVKSHINSKLDDDLSDEDVEIVDQTATKKKSDLLEWM